MVGNQRFSLSPRGSERPQQRHEAAERAGPVGFRVLLLGRPLPDRALGRGILPVRDEDRVVAEAAGPGGRRREAAGPAALDRVLGAVGTHERDDRHELRRTVRVGDIGELVEEQLEVGRRILLVPGPVRREHTGRSAQDVHRDTGVVGQRGQPRVRGGRARLDERVGGERHTVLDRLGSVVPDDLEVGTGRGDDRLELLDLVRIVGGQDDARHVSPPAPQSAGRAAARSR